MSHHAPASASTATVKLKHRACDECRTRKLACSKDHEGCVRCQRENIVCHYSEQKPMGRPRKRQFIKATREDTTFSGSIDVPEAGSIPYVPDDFSGYGDYSIVEPYFIPDITQTPLNRGRASKLDDGLAIWHFGGSDIVAGPPIDFGTIQPDLENTKGRSSTAPIPSLEQVPDFSAGSNISVTDSNNSLPQTTGSCCCLASMYLALASLQQLPDDIVGALKTVRGAVATAYQSIWCPQCGSIVMENPNPPIESFQNTMLLGTILPIIANGYQNVLKKIDKETDAAIAEGRTKTFKFLDYGRLCSNPMNAKDAIACIRKEMNLNALEMPPQNWRTTIRAFLRVDIYGHECSGFRYKGLKDLIIEIEARQRKRHDLLDAHLAAGLPTETTEAGVFGPKLCIGEATEKTYACLQILTMAKAAIDNLVIA